MYLFEAGAAEDVRTKDSSGNTPLYVACKHGRFDVVVWLCEVGAREDTQNMNDTGRSPLYIVCFMGHFELAKWLFDVGATADIRRKVNTGETPMWAACSNGHLAVAKWLFEVGAAGDVRTQDNTGLTPFSAACRNGYFAVVKWLFEVGAADDIRTQGRRRKSPLFLSCTKATVSSALSTWLLLHGAASDATSERGGGHINAGVLNEGVRHRDYRAAVKATLHGLISQHAVFTEHILPWIHVSAKAAPRVPLGNLCGHELTILPLISDYIGIIRGRQLRNAREAFRVMHLGPSSR
jgi:hypothetical protein